MFVSPEIKSHTSNRTMLWFGEKPFSYFVLRLVDTAGVCLNSDGVIGYRRPSSRIRPYDTRCFDLNLFLAAKPVRALTSDEGSADERLLISGSVWRGSRAEQLRTYTRSERKFSIQFPSNVAASKAYLRLNILMLGVWSNERKGRFMHQEEMLNVIGL